MIPKKCVTRVTYKVIVLKEKRSSIAFTNPKKRCVARVCVDGCAITEGIRCDYLVVCDEGLERYVELKGCDVAHAVAQIERTITTLSADRKKQSKRAYVVSTRCPMASPEIQNIQKRFKRVYNSQMFITKRMAEVAL